VCGNGCGVCDGKSSCLDKGCIDAVSCATCALRLSVADRSVSEGRLKRVLLSVDFSADAPEQAPRIADFRVRGDRGAKLTAVRLGPALRDHGKELYRDPQTKQPFRLRPDGFYQILVTGLGSSDVFGDGRLMTLEFAVDSMGPVKFWLERREQVFAPAPADEALQPSPYDAAVVVSR
jgi:hypothetical protein